MNQGLIPRRYAKALYKVASERNTAQQCYQLMKALSTSFELSQDLKDAIANPFVTDPDKVRLLETAAGATPADSTYNDFLRLLVSNRRIDLVGLIALAYLEVYRKANHICRVEVVSTAPLPEDVTERIKALVESHLDGGSMEYCQRINPDLIGGFTVDIDNQRLDASISTQLKELRLSLLK